MTGAEHTFLVVKYDGGNAVMKNFNHPDYAAEHVSSLLPGDVVLYHGNSDSQARAMLATEVAPREYVFDPIRENLIEDMREMQKMTPVYPCPKQVPHIEKIVRCLDALEMIS